MELMEKLDENNLVEQVYLIHHDGRVMAHVGKTRQGADQDLVGGMMIALADFARDSLAVKEQLKILDFGTTKIIIEKSTNNYLIAMVGGETQKGFRSNLASTLKNIEAYFGDYIEMWDGNRSMTAPAQRLMWQLIE